MALIVAKHRDKNIIIPNLEHQMIREIVQITSPPEFIQKVKLLGCLFKFLACPVKRRIKTISSRIRTLVVVVKNATKILPNRRVKGQLHLARIARISRMNSSSGIPFTAPDHSSSPRLIASVRLSSSESFGSAPPKLSKIIAARSARSPSLNFITSIPISESFMR